MKEHRVISSERVEDGINAVKWAKETQLKIEKGNQIAKILMAKYTPKIMAKGTMKK